VSQPFTQARYVPDSISFQKKPITVSNYPDTKYSRDGGANDETWSIGDGLGIGNVPDLGLKRSRRIDAVNFSIDRQPDLSELSLGLGNTVGNRHRSQGQTERYAHDQAASRKAKN
jgi:hypothetical protein